MTVSGKSLQAPEHMFKECLDTRAQKGKTGRNFKKQNTSPDHPGGCACGRCLFCRGRLYRCYVVTTERRRSDALPLAPSDALRASLPV